MLEWPGGFEWVRGVVYLPMRNDQLCLLLSGRDV
jgi:hypothetical protein